jgi:hypothetical protein
MVCEFRTGQNGLKIATSRLNRTCKSGAVERLTKRWQRQMLNLILKSRFNFNFG